MRTAIVRISLKRQRKRTERNREEGGDEGNGKKELPVPLLQAKPATPLDG